MDIIKEISIKNFRSIKTLNRKIKSTHLNIFVGQNDQGKSNLLRALNLFFNNQTDNGIAFRFEDDYSYDAPSGRGSKIEIKVELLIHPPRNRFRQATPVIWTKIWKKDGSINETRKHPDGTTLQDRNNVSQWLNKLKYRYVPAIKGQDYFSTLMGELYDVLNTIHSDALAKQGEGFIGGIQNITSEITKDLDKQLGIPNSIQVPSDFKALFSNLDFGLRKNGNTYHLKQRGDGIKVRHIPVILKYMSDQEKRISIPGYVKPDTIWGFEEPENNLEFKYAFEVAEEIKKYSTDIQIFITTHSPAFYALDKAKDNNIAAYYVSLNSENCTELNPISHDDNEKVHKDMGLLPIITPYLEEIYEREKNLIEIKEQLKKLKQKKCYFLTEDTKFDMVNKLLEYNSFDIEDTETVSYKGADSIHAAIVLGEYIKSKHQNSQIVIYRDKDYLSDEEIKKFYEKVNKVGFFFFTSKGTDVESYFISKEHILELYNDLNSNELEKAISEATEETRSDSVKRLVNHYMKYEKPEKGDYFGKYQELEKNYESNPERYRYGKKVLGRLQGKIQHIVGNNVDFTQKTKQLVIKELTDIAEKIWIT